MTKAEQTRLSSWRLRVVQQAGTGALEMRPIGQGPTGDVMSTSYRQSAGNRR
jgi:hypothetical protein